MKPILLFLSAWILLSSCSRTVYIVRHAEKVAANDTTVKMNATDPPLSESGKVRAYVLRDELRGKKIKHIYSTKTLRTVSTAEPLIQVTGLNVELYNTMDSLDYLVEKLKMLKGNSLVIGHSNTVDDIINKLTGEKKLPADLKDFEYDNLYMVIFRGKKVVFEQRKYGYPSNPE